MDAPGLSALYLTELSQSNEYGLSTLRDMMQAYMASPPSTSICSTLYPMVSYMTPHMTNFFKQQLVSGIFLFESMGDTGTNLASGVNLFWFLPANKAAPGYAAAVVAARSYSKAFSGKKQDQQMELFGHLSEVNHIISALLHFAAAIGVMSAPKSGQTPAAVLVCEALAATLHTTAIRHALQQHYEKQHIRCHHAFALVHDTLASFISQMTHFQQKNLAVSTGKMPAVVFRSTLQYILTTLPSRLIDLGRLSLAKEGLVTLTADTTFAAVAPAQAAPPRATTQRTTTAVSCRSKALRRYTYFPHCLLALAYLWHSLALTFSRVALCSHQRKSRRFEQRRLRPQLQLQRPRQLKRGCAIYPTRSNSRAEMWVTYGN